MVVMVAIDAIPRNGANLMDLFSQSDVSGICTGEVHDLLILLMAEILHQLLRSLSHYL